MSKQTSTGCYIAAWCVWVIALLAFTVARRYVDVSNPFSFQDPNLGGLILIIELLAVAMAVCWIGALVRLAKQHDWGWFAAAFMLHLIGLGIVGMTAYAVAGPIDVDLSRPGLE